MTSVASQNSSPSSLLLGDVSTAFLTLAFLLLLANILAAGLPAPLWLDENFSAAIATQPTFNGLLEWCLSELSGPLYYSVLWSWEKVAGNENIALRIPSMLFCVAAPAFLSSSRRTCERPDTPLCDERRPLSADRRHD